MKFYGPHIIWEVRLDYVVIFPNLEVYLIGCSHSELCHFHLTANLF